jgi:hypothetical protein
METLKRASFYIVLLTAVAAIGGLILVVLVLPSMNWSATRRPGQVESTIASYITPTGSAATPTRSPIHFVRPRKI